jgi:hypothetical protein
MGPASGGRYASSSLALTALQPATTYDFQVCNLHAIDGESGETTNPRFPGV